MPDPIMLILAGGAAGKIAERAMDLLLPEFQRAGAKAQREAVENAVQMLDRIATRLEDIENRPGNSGEPERLLVEGLGTPDFSYTVRQSILEAARTNSPIRHEILSRAVVERLLAAPETIQAVASAQAIEALGKLSGPQMELLGLAATIYYIGPVLQAPSDLPPDSTTRDVRQGMAQEAVGKYMKWLESGLQNFKLQDVATSALNLAHLDAAACVAYDPNLRRKLTDTLRSPHLTAHYVTELHYAYQWDLRLEGLGSVAFVGRLEEVWDTALQHLRLTPAGLLIGAGVHGFRNGEEVAIRWDSAPVDPRPEEDQSPMVPTETLSVSNEPPPMWDDHQADPRLVADIEGQLEDKERQRRALRGDARIL